VLADSSTITRYQYFLNGGLLDDCPHSAHLGAIENGGPPGTPPPENLPPDRPSSNAPSPDLTPDGTSGDTSGFNPFGSPVTLQEAQGTPGVYIKSGDMFILVRPQWREIWDWGWGIRSDVASLLFPDMSSKVAVLFNPGFQAPRIFNDAQLVIIGIPDIDIYETLDNGWTIPHGVNLGVWTNTGSVQTSLLDFYSYGANRHQVFEEINSTDPLDYTGRMIYTRTGWSLMRTHGILTGPQGYEYTFSWHNGSNHVERTYTADRRFFTIAGVDGATPIPNYFVSITEKGYDEIVFFDGLPLGFYSIGGDRIVEFVSP
jgi:hypothetical protein